MNNSCLELLLRKKVSHARLTGKIDFALADSCLTIKVREEGLKSNMQEDAAAFEGWAVALKYHLPEEIEKVVIDWDTPGAFTRQEQLSYNRFLYRLVRFTETYPWASSAKPTEALPFRLVCNSPDCEAAPAPSQEEAKLECQVVEEKRNNVEAIGRQLPVGLFEEAVSESTRFTTDGALDIWAVNKDELSIYELKTASNHSIGIISELMFYAHVVSDLLRHEINYIPSDALEKSKNQNYRSFGKFYELYEKQAVRKINAVFLTKQLYSLITPGLIDFINQSGRFPERGIRFTHETLEN